MPDKIRIILIDAKRAKVSELLIEPTLENYYALIGCKIIEGVMLDESNYLFVDEEGAINNTRTAFTLNGRLFNGSGVIVGTKGEDEADCSIDLETIKPLVGFNLAQLN